MPSLKLPRAPTINISKPEFKFKRQLDPPWHNGLGKTVKIISALILTNTTVVLVLGIISATSTNLSADTLKADQTYIERHQLLLYAELVFFYLTIPCVYVVTNVTENWVLWEDKLRPLYVICAAVIAINVWILQLVLWGPCMFASTSSGKNGGLKGPGYCPYLFKNHGVDLGQLQGVGTPRILFFAVAPLFLLYIAYLFLGIKAFRRERKRPEQKIDSFEMSRPYSGASRASDPESLPFRMSWPSGSSPPKSTKSSPDRDSYLSPKAQTEKAKEANVDEDGETTPSLRAEPIALMLTTPGGTNEDQNPFDSDRLSRLGHKVN